MVKNGAERIAVERARQVEREGWTAAHDDGHEDGALAMAAACYAAAAVDERIYIRDDAHTSAYIFVDPWPRDWEDKRRTHPTEPARIRMLVKAGALIAAEIDRVLREQAVAKDSAESGAPDHPNVGGVENKNA